MNTLATVLIALATAVLRVLLQQAQATKDARAVGRLTDVIENLEAQKRALAFKADAARDLVGAGDLRLRDGADAVRVPRADSGADRPPD